MRIVLGLVVLSLLGQQAEGQSTDFRLPGKNVALLIGTDAYTASREWPRLSSPVFDATTLAKTLAGDFAFDTSVVRNATKDDIIRTIVSHGKRATSGDDWSLVFIAAHGYFDEDRSQGYLVFRDSKPRSDDVARSSYLSLTELRGIIEGFKAGHVMLVIDACYAGTIDPDIRFGTDRAERGGANRRDIESSLLRRSQYRSRIYLTSGGKEYVPDGRPGAHSPFAGALLGALRQASNDGRALTFNQIVGHMADQGIEPLPRHNVFRGHEPGGDFILLPRSFSAASAAEANTTPRSDRAPERPTRGGNEPPRTTEREAGRTTTTALSRPVLLRVEVTSAQRGQGDLDAVRQSVASQVQAALLQHGFTNVLSAPAESAAPAGGGAKAAGAATNVARASSGLGACAEERSPIECITVTVRVTPSIANNRQSVQVSFAAIANRTQQALASDNGRAGPYALDVPPDRVVTRAVDSALERFLASLTAAMSKAGS